MIYLIKMYKIYKNSFNDMYKLHKTLATKLFKI